MNHVKNRLALCSMALALMISGSSGAYAGTDTPTCADLINFNATLVGSNAACDQLMYFLSAELDGFDDCLAPASVIVVEAEDGAVPGGPKIPVFISPCAATPGLFVSNISVLPFFSSGVVKFTYRIDTDVDVPCGDVTGTTMVTLPDIATVVLSPAVTGLTSTMNGATTQLNWTLPGYAGDGYRSISVQRRALFGAAAPGPYECLQILPGDFETFTESNPVLPAGATGFEYRLIGILNPTPPIVPPPAAIEDCDDFDAAAPGALCSSLESTITVLPPPTATLVIEDCVMSPPNTPGVIVPVTMTSANHFGVTSVGIAVAHNNAEITACAVTVGDDAAALIVGGVGGIGFTTTSIGTDGVTAALITDITVVPLQTIPVGVDLEVFKLCYNTLATPNITSAIQFSSTLQIPQAPIPTFATTEVFALTNVANNFSQPILPPDLTLVDGSIKILSADFVRGDFDGDMQLTLTDAILIFQALFGGAAGPPIGCQDLLDINDNGIADVTDVTLLIGYLFGSVGTPPSPPFGLPLGAAACGPDPTPDALDCLNPPAYCP